MKSKEWKMPGMPSWPKSPGVSAAPLRTHHRQGDISTTGNAVALRGDGVMVQVQFSSTGTQSTRTDPDVYYLSYGDTRQLRKPKLAVADRYKVALLKNHAIRVKMWDPSVTGILQTKALPTTSAEQMERERRLHVLKRTAGILKRKPDGTQDGVDYQREVRAEWD